MERLEVFELGSVRLDEHPLPFLIRTIYEQRMGVGKVLAIPRSHVDATSLRLRRQGRKQLEDPLDDAVLSILAGAVLGKANQAISIAHAAHIPAPYDRFGIITVIIG